MSVWLNVGDYASDPAEVFAPINAALRAVGLPEHHEPELPQRGLPWSWEIGGYGCLALLCRVAAYVALRQQLPKPTMDWDEVWNDPVVQEYYDQYPREVMPRRPRSDSQP